MSHRDDEEITAASSGSAEYFKSDKGRKDALRREIEAKRGTMLTGKELKGLKSLKTQVTLRELQNQMTSPKQDQAKSGKEQKEEAKKHETFTTKSTTEQAARQVETANSKASPDRQIEKTKQENTEKHQAGQEYQSQAG